MTKEFSGLKFLICIIYISFCAFVTNISGKASIGFYLGPLVLLFFDIPFYAYYSLILFSFIFCYEPFLLIGPYILISDSLIIGYIFFKLIKSPQLFFTFVFRKTTLQLVVIAFAFYCFLQSVIPFSQGHVSIIFIQYTKVILYLFLVPFMARKSIFTPKKIGLIVFTILLAITLKSFITIGTFAAFHDRVTTWNEIYFVDGIIISICTYWFTKNKKTRLLLIACILLFSSALIVVETRSLWIGTLAAASIIGLSALIKYRYSIKWVSLFKTTLISVLIITVSSIGLSAVLGVSTTELITKRLHSSEKGEEKSPWSSTGYRVYEAVMVWKNRTFWGHGTGATLHIVATQIAALNPNDKHANKWWYWWGIHSEYVKILHFYGFAGLFLYISCIITTIITGFRLFTNKKRFIAILGAMIFAITIAHAIISISSGYIIRDNVVPFFIFVFSIAIAYTPVKRSRKIIKEANET